MPKRKAVRGRRGGGTASRKTAEIAAEVEEAEVKTNLNSSQGSSIDLELETVDNSVSEYPDTDHTVDEVLSLQQDISEPTLKQDITEPALEQDITEPALEQDITEPTLEQDITEPTLEQDITEPTLGPGPDSDIQMNATRVEETSDSGFSKEIPDDDVENVAEKCQQLEEIKETGTLEETAEVNSEAIYSEDTILATKEIHEEWAIAEQLEDELLGTVDNAGDNEGTVAEVCFVDKEVEDDQKEMEDIQYIDEEACEDQQLSDIMDNIGSEETSAMQDCGSQKKNATVNQSENPVDLNENGEVSADIITVTADESQTGEDADNSKFEEISEGSINQDHEELNAEAVSDVEIIEEFFVPKKTQNKKAADVQEVQIKEHYKEAETLEEVFFATENDDVKITAEDKDNDDISDASLSDLADANLSLEEISDDDLEPSKKRRKPSGMTPRKTEKIDANTKPDVESIANSDEKTERAKTNQTVVTLPKRPASDNNDANTSKRFKMSSERKSSEVALPKAENDSGTCVDLKKEGKNKESELSHGRNVLHKGSQQPFKNEQQESRERSQASRDLIEHKRKCELVSSACQTEPRQLKGKIIQCNINPIKSFTESDQVKKLSETIISVSKLLSKFRNQLPSSIPEKVFLDVTTLQPPQKENTYSFSLGPVTLSDMDCPKFRDVLRVPEEFSLTFDRHYQGILKASLARHESLSSMISHLQRLELGNRYMVMSVVYKHGLGRNVGIWKATLMFMYEQDIQVESQSLISDGKIRAKLCLKGVPQGVSKDFIQLLFPEAVNVSTGPGSLEERTIILGFSNTKMVEEILSCYDLLIICGSQIKISQADSPEVQQSMTAAVTIGESGDVNREDPKLNDEIPVKCDKQQKELELHLDSISKIESEDSKQDEMNQGGLNIDNNTEDILGNVTVIQDQKDVDLKATEDMSLLSGNDSGVEVTQTTVETDVTETASTTDFSPEDVKVNLESIQNNSTIKQTERADVDKPSESLLDESVVNNKIVTDEDPSKPEASAQEDTGSEIELEKNTEISSVSVEDASRDTAEEKVCDEIKNIDVKKFDKEVKELEKEVNKETNDENLEDVSDEEILNQSRHEDPDDVVILREDSSQWVAASIDLTNEESNTSVKVLNESTRNITEEKYQQPTVHDRKTSDSKVTTDGGDSEGKKMDPKLVMTDGGLEVSMEVIDVDEGYQELDKVIYARTWRPSQGTSRENPFRVTPGPSRASHYVHMPLRETQWSYPSKSDAYYHSRDPYKYPLKERMPRHYYSRISHEESPRYHVPAREQTSLRRDSYSSKYRRYLSPSPTRVLNVQGHSNSHASDHWSSYNEQWDKRSDNWRPRTYGESRRTESSSRPGAETSSRQVYLQSRSTTHHSSHTYPEDQHASVKPSDHYSRVDSRSSPYVGHKYNVRKSRTRSLSSMSISSEDQVPPPRKTSHRRESPKQPVLHFSRSPISVSSRSHSLSPVSKSPSVEYSPIEKGKEELVKTVKHFLELAKGIHQTKKRRPNRSRSPKSPPLRHSKSPHKSSSLVRKIVRSSRHQELQSPHRMRSRSPPPSWSRNSRSPSYTKSQRYKYDRSPSPSSRGDGYKRHKESRSYSDRRRSPRRDSVSPEHRYESKKSQRVRDSSRSYEEQGSRSKSGQGSEQKYKSSSDQPWQQPLGGYQMSQSSGPATSGSIYNPACPPPACPPQQQPSTYSSSSVPLYQYSNPSQFNYSSIPPPYVPPPAPIAQSYQSTYSVYQPPQPYASTGHHSAPVQPSTTGGLSSNSSSSKTKKSWSMGSSALVFQRVLGSDNKGGKKNSSGVIEKIEDRERLERPKYTKPERVLTKVQMERK